MSDFPHSKLDSTASIKPRSNYVEFFSVSDPPAPVRYFMILYLKSRQLVASVRPVYCVNATRFLICCLSGAGRYRSMIF